MMPGSFNDTNRGISSVVNYQLEVVTIYGWWGEGSGVLR